jgi:hypothetical protein
VVVVAVVVDASNMGTIEAASAASIMTVWVEVEVRPMGKCSASSLVKAQPPDIRKLGQVLNAQSAISRASLPILE